MGGRVPRAGREAALRRRRRNPSGPSAPCAVVPCRRAGATGRGAGAGTPARRRGRPEAPGHEGPPCRSVGRPRAGPDPTPRPRSTARTRCPRPRGWRAAPSASRPPGGSRRRASGGSRVGASGPDGVRATPRHSWGSAADRRHPRRWSTGARRRQLGPGGRCSGVGAGSLGRARRRQGSRALGRAGPANGRARPRPSGGGHGPVRGESGGTRSPGDRDPVQRTPLFGCPGGGCGACSTAPPTGRCTPRWTRVRAHPRVPQPPGVGEPAVNIMLVGRTFRPYDLVGGDR